MSKFVEISTKVNLFYETYTFIFQNTSSKLRKKCKTTHVLSTTSFVVFRVVATTATGAVSFHTCVVDIKTMKFRFR